MNIHVARTPPFRTGFTHTCCQGQTGRLTVRPDRARCDSASFLLAYLVRAVSSLRARGSDHAQSSIRVQKTITIPAYQAATRADLEPASAGSRSSSPHDSETGPVSQRGVQDTAQCWQNIQHIILLCISMPDEYEHKYF